MGFFDRKIKGIFEECPRLTIESINSIFGKNYATDAKVEYLDKEQNIDDESETFMDMLLRIENCKYHFEFQLLEDNMEIRMYEYGVKETIRELHHSGNQSQAKYEINIQMPYQAVIFLAGVNHSDRIMVNLTLPDGKQVSYEVPCISASQSIEELISKKLYILIPFQQVQLNKKLNDSKTKSKATKHKLAIEIYRYHSEMKNSLDKLYYDDILNLEEHKKLSKTVMDIEDYLIDKDVDVRLEVKAMGDKDYIPLSERIEQEAKERGKQLGMQQGIQEGIQQGIQEGIQQGIQMGIAQAKKVLKLYADGMQVSDIANELSISEEEVKNILED